MPSFQQQIREHPNLLMTLCMVLNKTERPSLWKTITTEAFIRTLINRKANLCGMPKMSMEFNLGQLSGIGPVFAL